MTRFILLLTLKYEIFQILLNLILGVGAEGGVVVVVGEEGTAEQIVGGQSGWRSMVLLLGQSIELL